MTVTSYATERSAAEVAADAACLERVKKGIAWLQQTWGDDWVEHIDMEKLSHASASCCILGQLYAYGKYGFSPSQYGFDADRSEETRFKTGRGVTDNYARLDKIWKQMIQAWQRGVHD